MASVGWGPSQPEVLKIQCNTSTDETKHKKRCCLYYKFTQYFPPPPSVGFKHVLIFVASSNKVCVSFPLSTGLQNFYLPYMWLFKAVQLFAKNREIVFTEKNCMFQQRNESETSQGNFIRQHLST